MTRVAVGVDGYPRGWVALRLVDGAIDDLRGYPTFSDVLAANADADGIAVDMPIGLPIDAPRRADAVARRFLKARSSSVFTTGPRAALERRDDHASASAISRSTIGVGLSIQALGIAPKILELDDLDLPDHVFEVHPEVSFQLLAEAAGIPLPLPRKRSWAGLRARLERLSTCGVDLLAHPSRPVAGLDRTSAATLRIPWRRVVTSWRSGRSDRYA